MKKKAGKLIWLMTAIQEIVPGVRNHGRKYSALTKGLRHNQQNKQWRKHISEKI